MQFPDVDAATAHADGIVRRQQGAFPIASTVTIPPGAEIVFVSGTLADPGSVAYNFHRKGVIVVSGEGAEEDAAVQEGAHAGGIRCQCAGAEAGAAVSDGSRVRASWRMRSCRSLSGAG